jgi:hypothetical protein
MEIEHGVEKSRQQHKVVVASSTRRTKDAVSDHGSAEGILESEAAR